MKGVDLDPARSQAGKYGANASNCHGVQIGDNGLQYNIIGNNFINCNIVVASSREDERPKVTNHIPLDQRADGEPFARASSLRPQSSLLPPRRDPKLMPWEM
jgi:hypothetical protein